MKTARLQPPGGPPPRSMQPPPSFGLGEPDLSYLEKHRAAKMALLLGLAAIVLVIAIAYLNYTYVQPTHRIVKMILGGVMALVFLARPDWSLGLLPLAFAYLIWLPKSPIPMLNTMNLLFASLVYGSIARSVATRRPVFDHSPLNLPLIALLIWLVFAWLHPIVLETAPREAILPMLQSFWASISGLVLFFLVYSNVRSWKQIRTLALLFCVGSAAGLAGLLSEVSRDGWRRGVGGGVGQVNVAAAYFAAATMFGLGLLGARYPGLWRRLLLFFSAVATAAALTIAGSRGAFVAFLAGGLAHVFRAGIVWVVLLGLLVGGFLLWAPDYVVERVTRAEDAVTAEEGRLDAVNEEGGGRIDFWRAGLQVIADNPVLGVGYAQSPRVLGEARYLGRPRPLHNLYLQTAAEMGIPGLILLLWFFIAALSGAAPLLAVPGFPRALALSFQAVVIVLMVANFFGDRFFAFNMAGMIGFLGALVFRARRLLEEEEWARWSAAGGREDGGPDDPIGTAGNHAVAR